MSRRTAFERVRVAHELKRRPEVRARFESGALSYSKVRAITRVKGADDETDERLLEVAETGTTADLERLARHFEQLEEQERGVDDYLRRYERRTIRMSRTYDGMMVIEKVVPLEEGEEYLAHLDAGSECSAEHSSTGPLLCPQHHTCTHEGGFGVSGDANGTLTFVRPDGTILGRTAA